MASPTLAICTGPQSNLQGRIVPDTDDGYSSSNPLDSEDESLYTASVSSSIRAYREENGRTYSSFKEGSYLFPNDETENDRLDMQHAVFLRSLGGKLCLAPIPKDVQDVLDIGTGTGLWALDFADEYPSAQVTGTDLSPIQPSYVPPNLSFLVDDAEAEWRFRDKFDFIHGRMLTGSLGDWDNFYRQCYDNLKPGAYLEMQDTQLPLGCDDGTMPPTTALAQWSSNMIEACKKLNRPFHDIGSSHKAHMEAAGFVDVVEVEHKWPMNTWPKDEELKQLGAWTMVNMLQGLAAFSLAPSTRGLGWEREKLERFLVDVRKDVRDRKIHTYWLRSQQFSNKFTNSITRTPDDPRFFRHICSQPMNEL
ncbi:hypothetical protein AJ79_07722 [Helicocarpus griseus UAMH5409]|uniref:Methyltransferase domain-containing protein n=1 Tax=Helicocarpus griseus UAMH5409 TaxID=1447875 RepID=A0A2B7WZH5_9EURO|nr:hypothetical protein AJ79_07722 [Helicocarpus griseus UAMH5409]